MGRLPRELPSHRFEKRNLSIGWWRPHWVAPIFAEYERCCRKPGWNPKVVPLGDDLLMIDFWGYTRCRQHLDRHQEWQAPSLHVPLEITVVRYEDHPFLSQLPANAPRAVRSLYKREVRLRHARAMDGWDESFMVSNAGAAWKKFLAAQDRAGNACAAPAAPTAEQAWAKYIVGGDTTEKVASFLDGNPGFVVVFRGGHMELEGSEQ